MKNIKPIGKNYLLKREVVSNVTKSGIITGLGKEKDSLECEVVGVGSSIDHDHIKVGDKVLVGRYASTLVSEKSNLVLITEDNILAVVG